jgi:hypothetical protein
MTSTILRSLNALAAAIELTYAAGQSCGRRLWPTLHWLWDAINWRDVAEIVLTGLVITAAGSWLLLCWSHHALIGLSERLGRQFSAVLVGKPDECPAPSIAMPSAIGVAEPATCDAEIVRPPAVETLNVVHQASAFIPRRQRRSRRRGHTPPSSQPSHITAMATTT